jgi:hypothetical protein
VKGKSITSSISGNKNMNISQLGQIIMWEETTGNKYPRCHVCKVLYADFPKAELCEFHEVKNP